MKKNYFRCIVCLALGLAVTSGTWAMADEPEQLVVFNTNGSVYYIPQVANGQATSYYYGTEFLINNTAASSTNITISFYGDNASPWSMDLRSFDHSPGTNPATSFSFTLAAYETAHYFTGAGGPIQVGWAVIRTSQPVVISANFHFFTPPYPYKLTWEAGVLPSPAATKWCFDANVSQDDHISGIDVDMGFAVGNPSDSIATITATLFPHTGGVALNTKTVTVPAGGHTSNFLTGLFNDTAWGTYFHGYVEFSSNVNVAMVALKHSYGNASDVYSSLAVRPSSELNANIIYDREDNGTFTNAQTITTPCEIIGTQNSPGDGSEYDVYAVQCSAGQVLYVFTMADFLGSPLNPVFTIYDPSHTQIGYVNDFSTGLNDPFLRVPITTTGIHYIQTDSIGGTYARNAFYHLFVLVK